MISNPFRRLAGHAPEIRLSSNDFRILLNEIKAPALLINLSRSEILSSNFAFTDLTGFGSDEIIGSTIEKLIPDAQPDKLADGMVQIWNLARKNRNALPANITTRFINQNSGLAIMTIEARDSKTIELEPASVDLVTDLVSNLNCLFDGNLDDLIEDILTSVKDTFRAGDTVFYLQDGKDNEPCKVRGKDHLFPDKIPAVEAKRLNQIDFWEPGKRVLSEINRAGRMNNLPAVITMPIEINPNLKGFLVIVLDDLKQREQIETLLQPISAWINALLKNHQIFLELSESNRVFAEEVNQYGQFYENASDCALILNEDNVVLDCNQNACNFLKYSQVELIHQKSEAIFENSAIIETLQTNDLTIHDPGKDPAFIFDREGNRKPVAYKVLPLEDKYPRRKLLVITDLTNATEAAKKIREFEDKAALGDMIADFAHEVRNPMNSFVSGLQVLRKKTAADDSIHATIEQMLDDCVRINDLMESVLSYSRQKIENFKDVDLELLLRRILSQNSTKFKQNKVEALFQTKVPHSITTADQRSLEQAFINLINNAYDAIKPDGGMISVQIDQKGTANEFIEVSISDTGPGIPPEIREKLFEPFVSGKPKGTGLGLAITKRMVEAHHGKIELETYPGGTIFRVILPNKAEQGEPA